MGDQEKDERQSTKDFLAEALKRFKLAEEAESDIRKEGLDDLNFSIGEQWPDGIKSQREQDGRPCLVINKFPQSIRQVTNAQREQRPAIHINPVGDGATVETAEILQGIVRHIETNSEAEIAYDHAFDMMVRTGFGYWRVLTDYVRDGSFEQEIFIKRIKNPFTVFFDPHTIEADYSDAKWAFIIEDVEAEAFKEQFPDAAASTTDFSSSGNLPPGWMTKNTIRIAEYFYVIEERFTLYQLADGSLVRELPEEVTAHAQREQIIRHVHWAKITATDILDEKVLPGSWIPIVPILGDDLDVDGKRHVAGLIRHAKDPQRTRNYWISSATETVALAPRVPYIGVEGQFEGHEDEWRQANVRSYAYLEYKEKSISGQPAPPPQRQVFEPPIKAMDRMISQSDVDMQGTMGIHAPRLGEAGPEVSGRAILARQKQSELATMNFGDNLARAMRFTGRIILAWIPKIYDTPRIQRIVNPDASVDQVIIYNGQEQIAVAQGMFSKTIRRIFDIGLGRYDVTVSIGPSYQSKRQETAATMIELVRAYPKLADIAPDLLFRSMDWPGAQEIADRFKKMLPPQLVGGDGQDPKIQVQRLQAQLQQLMQQQQLLTKALEESTETINTKKLELESKERIAAEQNRTKLILAELQANREAGLAALRAQLETINKRLDLLGESERIEETI